MIRRSFLFALFTALVAVSSAVQAQISLPGGKPTLVKTPYDGSRLPLVAKPREDVTPIGLTGRVSFDSFGTPGNELSSTDLGTLLGTPGGAVRVTGIGWNTTLETVGLSWASEAAIDFNGQVVLRVGAGVNNPTPAGGQAFSSGGIVDLIGLNLDFVAPTGILDLQFYETFDDNIGGIDATYLNGSLDIQFEASQPPQPPMAQDLGVIGNTNTAIFNDTRGSSFDTELGVYDSLGNLLATNDDIDLAGGNLNSEILLGTLPVGTYYTALGGFETVYGAGWDVTGGGSNGNFIFNYNGGSVNGALAAGEVRWFSFQIAPVPEPSSVFLVLGGSVLLLARRRK